MPMDLGSGFRRRMLLELDERERRAAERATWSASDIARARRAEDLRRFRAEVAGPARKQRRWAFWRR